MRWTGRQILRGHALCLLALTPTLTVLSYVGVLTGRGPYGGLAENPLAVSGLAQAYPLMGLIGMVMWVGARGPAPHRASRLAIAAHCVPLSALAMLWGPIMASSIGPAIPFSFAIHGCGIAAELLSVRRGYGGAPT